jgi:hypothetical protein
MLEPGLMSRRHSPVCPTGEIANEEGTIMVASNTENMEQALRTLTMDEIDAVSGGFGFLVGAAIFAAGAALGFAVTTEVQRQIGDFPQGGCSCG